MAYSIFSSSFSSTQVSIFFCNPHSPPGLLKPTPFLHKPTLFLQSPTLKHFNYPLSIHQRTSLQNTPVSIQGPILQEIQNSNSSEVPQLQYPDQKANPSSSKCYIWVNPKSSRALELRRQSYNARYTFLVGIAESLNSCYPNEKDVYRILSPLVGKIVEPDAVVVLNNMSNPETAPIVLKFFQHKLELTSREVILYNVALKVFRKCKDLDRAEKLFDEMIQRGIKPDNMTFSAIISCASLSSSPEKAVEWYEKMPSYGCQPDDIHNAVIIDACGRTGNIDMALSLYDRVRARKWRFDALTFSTLIKIYGMSGNFDGCLNVYEEMKSLSIKPTLAVYNSLLDAMGRAKRPWQAKSIYEEIISIGFTPSWATYSALLRAYSRARYCRDGFKVYKEMKGKGMTLNLTLYNSILAMFADTGYVDEAVEVFEDMKRSGTCKPDSRTFSSLMTIYSCCGKVSAAKATFDEMLTAGFEPTIFVLTSLVQCYGKANQTDDVVRTFNLIFKLGLTPDDWFCACLLNVIAQTPEEELGKLTSCMERANAKLGYVLKLLVEGENVEGEIFMREARELFNSFGANIAKGCCNSLIDICVKLNMSEKARELLDLGLTLEIYTNIQSKSSMEWSLHLKSFSFGAALTALDVWMNDLSKALESGNELPPVLCISTGHGKHKYSDQGLAAVVESHLKELNAPFHELKVGWFSTTKDAAKSWLESRRSHELVGA